MSVKSYKFDITINYNIQLNLILFKPTTKRVFWSLKYTMFEKERELPARRVPRRLKAIHFVIPCSKYSSITSGKSPCNGSSLSKTIINNNIRTYHKNNNEIN